MGTPRYFSKYGAKYLELLSIAPPAALGQRKTNFETGYPDAVDDASACLLDDPQAANSSVMDTKHKDKSIFFITYLLFVLVS
jgi:hypothetical protein